MAEAVERIVKLFPAFLAGGLALVYVLGAVVTGSAFEGAGIDPQDAVPLLSLEQLLARGIGVLVAPATFLLVLTFAAAALSTFFSLVLRNQVTSHRNVDERAFFQAERKVLAGSVLITSLVGFMSAPINQLPGLGVAFVAIALAGGLFLFGNAEWRSRKASLISIALLGIVLGLLTNAYTDPTPSAKVVLELQGRSDPARGTLVTHSNSTWYVYSERSEEISAYSDTAVVVATIDKRPSGESNDDSNLISYAWEEFASLPPF